MIVRDLSAHFNDQSPDLKNVQSEGQSLFYEGLRSLEFSTAAIVLEASGLISAEVAGGILVGSLSGALPLMAAGAAIWALGGNVDAQSVTELSQLSNPENIGLFALGGVAGQSFASTSSAVGWLEFVGTSTSLVQGGTGMEQIKDLDSVLGSLFSAATDPDRDSSGGQGSLSLEPPDSARTTCRVPPTDDFSGESE